MRCARKNPFCFQESYPKKRELMIVIHNQLSGRVHTHPHTRCGGFTLQKLYTQKNVRGDMYSREHRRPCRPGGGPCSASPGTWRPAIVRPAVHNNWRTSSRWRASARGRLGPLGDGAAASARRAGRNFRALVRNNVGILSRRRADGVRMRGSATGKRNYHIPRAGEKTTSALARLGSVITRHRASGRGSMFPKTRGPATSYASFARHVAPSELRL